MKTIAAMEATGLPALSDDSGLCVDALDGDPGSRRVRTLKIINTLGQTPRPLDKVYSCYHKTPEGEALRRDDEFAFSAVWEFQGVGERPALHKEQLTFENVQFSTRSYK